jgi:hypothetical protein
MNCAVVSDDLVASRSCSISLFAASRSSMRLFATKPNSRSVGDETSEASF